MHRARQILAVTLVATAICADRAVAARPASVRHATSDARGSSMTGRLVSRISQNFRRDVCAVRLYQQRPDSSAPIASQETPEAPGIVRTLLDPLQLRLPPPLR
jgi:hypothetical protein